MKYIKDLQYGDRVSNIYLCKKVRQAATKAGKPYLSLELQDKTGSIDAKIWEPNSEGIEDFDVLDYVDIFGDVTSFNNAPQINVKRARKCQEGEYNPSDYVPVSARNNDEMYQELCTLIDSIENPYLHGLADQLFRQDQDFVARFRSSSAAKTVHHGFMGGLLEHTLSVAALCDHMSKKYPILNRDLLITSALCHDIGKTKELSAFPENDYTDPGQLLGHIVIGVQMVAEAAAKFPGFPPLLLEELQHCIVAHHGEFNYGSPKKPAIIEALALNLADNMDAKMETFKEILEKTDQTGCIGYNRFFETSLFVTRT